MKSWREQQGIVISLEGPEREVLARLADLLVETVSELLPDDDGEFASILAEPVSPSVVASRSPALRRLFPSAYDDAEADAEFRKYTESDSAHDKINAALVVRDSLRNEEIVILSHQYDSWLRTLTAIRLMLSESKNPALDPIADWVGWLLEILLDI